jgi:hypothetical protein
LMAAPPTSAAEKRAYFLSVPTVPCAAREHRRVRAITVIELRRRLLIQPPGLFSCLLHRGICFALAP